jgi:8-oxo-dGTP pyrophosphatase MutT (NUDIX family)
MPDLKKSRCGFAIIKLRIDAEDYWLMRKDPDWKDVTFIGGHVDAKDGGDLKRTAQRELLEEVPAARVFRNLTLAALTPHVAHGPVFSPSARSTVLYDFRFFLLRFTSTPIPLLQSLGPKSLNVLIPQQELLRPETYRIASLVSILDRAVPGGLPSIAYSWDEEVHSRSFGGYALAQADLAMR